MPLIVPIRAAGIRAASRFPLLIVPLLLVVAITSGCKSRTPFTAARPFQFEADTFHFANELVWDYYWNDEGKWVHKRHEPDPDYTHHCFVVARSARQFFQHARFDPTKPVADEATYRKLINRVVGIDPARVIPDKERIVIPGYANLREFSTAQERLLKDECGGAWRSYFQRGHWRILFPFSRRGQLKVANSFLQDLKRNEPPVAHLIQFPELTINHAVLVFYAVEREREIEFKVYDPNKPESPKTLLFDRHRRTFSFAGNDYWPGGDLNVYEIYRSPFF